MSLPEKSRRVHIDIRVEDMKISGDGSRDLSDAAISQRMPTDAQSWKRQGMDSLQSLQREQSSADSLVHPPDSHFWSPEL